MLAILAAFGHEITDLRRQMVIDEVDTGRFCMAYRGRLKGRDCLLARTGMGKERAENAAQFLLQRYSVNTIVSVGFAAALTPQLRAGDVVVCSTLHCATGLQDTGRRLESRASDARLLSIASQLLGVDRVSSCIGSSIVVPKLPSSPERIQEFGEAFSVQIAEMESYWIAQIASAHQIPFIAIRSISETMHDSLAPFDQILASDGRLLWRRAVLSFLLHPRDFVNVFTIFRRVQPARRNLGIFVAELVARI